MTALYEDTNPKDLRVLLDDIHQGGSVLPEFQRDFVWEPGAVAELILSVAQSFPAGSLLRIRNSKDYFASRPFEGAPAPKSKPTFLVLDGQQRLTSLYQAFYGIGTTRFFVDLRKLIDGGELEDALWFCPAKRAPATKYLPKDNSPEARDEALRRQAEDLVFPLGCLRASLDAFSTWKNEVIKLRAAAGNNVLELMGQLDKVAGELVSKISAYEFPVVTLSEDTSAEAICTIFETLNRTGVKLSPFELLTARFFPQGINLRTLWSTAKIAHPIIEEFQLDPYTVLQAITLRVSKPVTMKRAALMNLTGAQIEETWPSTVEALAQALTFLQDDCGVTTPKWLPYSTLLAPLAAAIAEHPINEGGPLAGARRGKLRCWFWRACLGQYYEAAAGTKSEQDYDQLPKWFAGGPPPESVATYRFDTADLEQTTPRQRATYRALMCLVTAGGARDFHSGKLMSAALVRANKVEDHHLFPLDFLGEKNRRSPDPRFDNILNRTLIDAETNRRIGANSPAIYLPRIDEVQGSPTVNAVLASHGIDGAACDALRAADYGAFLQHRRAWFEAQVAERTAVPGESTMKAA